MPMRRRYFIAGLAAATWSSSVHAQSISRHYHIGLLDATSRNLNANFSAFQQGLREHGYVEGQNLTFEYRSADGRNESFAELARELVRLNVDLTVTSGPPPPLPPKSSRTT